MLALMRPSTQYCNAPVKTSKCNGDMPTSIRYRLWGPAGPSSRRILERDAHNELSQWIQHICPQFHMCMSDDVVV